MSLIILRENSYLDDGNNLQTEIENRLKVNSAVRIVTSTLNQNISENISAEFTISKLTKIGGCKHKQYMFLCTALLNNNHHQVIVYQKQFHFIFCIVTLVLDFLHAKSPKQIQSIFNSFNTELD